MLAFKNYENEFCVRMRWFEIFAWVFYRCLVGRRHLSTDVDCDGLSPKNEISQVLRSGIENW